MEQTLLELFIDKGLPFVILVVIIYIIYKRMINLESKIDELQKELRESDKEHLTTLHQTTALIDKFIKNSSKLLKNTDNTNES